MSTYSSFKPGVAGVAALTAGTDTSVNTSTGYVIVWNTSTLQSITSRGSTTSYAINITNNIQSSSTTTGALVVAGGVGIGGNLTLNGSIVSSSATFSGIVTDTSGIPSISTATGAVILTNNGGIGVGGQVTAQTIKTIDTTLASISGAGSVQTAGGVYIGNNLVVMSTQSSTVTQTANALYIAGGTNINGQLTVGGPVLFKGQVLLSNSATQIVAGNTVYTTNLITLHTPSTGTNWTFNDGLDVGIKFRFYANSTDTSAVLVLANDTKYLEFYGSGAVGTSSFSNANYGTFKTGQIILVSATNATSTLSGSLQLINGGAAIGQDIYVGGQATIASASDASASSGALLVKNGGASISKSLYVGSSLATTTASNGNAVVINGGIGVGSSGYFGGNVVISSNLSSTSTNTGQALLVTGGIGSSVVYARELYDNGRRVITKINPNSGTGISISTSNNVDSILSFTVTNIGVTSIQAGSGIGVNTNTGAVLVNNLGVTSITGTAGQIAVNTTTGAVVLSLPFGLSFNTSSVTSLYITSQQSSISTNTGALQVAGGIGIGNSIFVGSTATIQGSIYRTGNISAANWANSVLGIGLSIGDATYTETSTTGSYISNQVAVNSFGVPTLANNAGNITYGDAATVYISGAPVSGLNSTITTPWSLLINDGRVKIGSTASSNSIYSGALVVNGGIGVGGSIVAGGTGQFASGGVLIGNTLISSITASTNSLAIQNIDSYNANFFRSAKYFVQAVSASGIHITEISLMHNGINVYKNEYGISTTNGELGAFDANFSTGLVTLTFTPYTTATISLTISRTALTS